MVAEGRANLQNLVSATFSISDINKAFDYAASGQGMKALIINP
jgi:L-iditol 2-dehydrogenase